VTTLIRTDRTQESAWSLLGALALGAVLGVAIFASGGYAVMALAGVLAFALYARYPAVGLYVTTVLLLLSGSAGVLGALRVAVPLTLAKVSGAALLVAWAGNVLVRRQRVHVGKEMIILAAFFAWAGVGVFASSYYQQQWPEWVRLATLVAFFALSVQLLDSPATLHRYLVLLCVCGLLMSLFAIAQYFIPALQLDVATAVQSLGAGAEGAYIDPDSLSGGAAVRVSGRAGHSNWLAMALLVLLPLNAYWFGTARTRRMQGAVLLTAGCELIALVLTFTRTGFLIGFVAAALLLFRRLIHVGPRRATALAMVVFLSWFLLPGPYKERVLTFTQYSRSDSVSHRLELQEAAFDIMTESPVWGVGLGGFGTHIIEKTSQVAYIMRWLVEDQNWNPVFLGAHNLYLQLACDTGLVGLALILLFFGALLRRLRRARQDFEARGEDRLARMTAVLGVSMLTFLCAGIFLHALQQKIWWMIAAVATVIAMRHEDLADRSSAVSSDGE